MGRYYKWEQGNYGGIIESDSIEQARKDAKYIAPGNPYQESVRVVKATKTDGDWFMGMGGGIGGKALDATKFWKRA